MKRKKPDIKADIPVAIDRGESVSAMEPMLISQNSAHRPNLTDLVLELSTKAASFRRSLPPATQNTLANLVRSMNCYYSNLIEGHDTHPIAIEQALAGNYSADVKKRNLQLEAKAHITVQEWIDHGGMTENPLSPETICEIHKRFYALLPEELLWVTSTSKNEKMKVIPGEFRQQDVQVGQHIAISPGAIPRFLQRFTSIYHKLTKTETILSLGAIHHRLLWVHPFLDGNGRVARLVSHALILQTLDTGSMWSVSRGLARHTHEYKNYLANCDLQRRNDLDGRGNLSEEALSQFSKFFLETCIDQVNFMEKLVQPDRLSTRILLWAKEEVHMKNLPLQTTKILEAILQHGEIARSEIPNMLNISDRHARRITNFLTEKNILVSDSQKSHLKLNFPAHLVDRWLPGLFPG